MRESANQSRTVTARITWNIPSIFRQHTGGNSDVELEVADARFQTALRSLLTLYPGLASHIDLESLKPKSYTSIFHNDRQITDFGVDLSLRDGDELVIVPALAGG